MLAYRIIIDNNELKYYKNNKIYYDNEPIFNVNNHSLYEVNTFPNKDGLYKYFGSCTYSMGLIPRHIN